MPTEYSTIPIGLIMTCLLDASVIAFTSLLYTSQNNQCTHDQSYNTSQPAQTHRHESKTISSYSAKKTLPRMVYRDFDWIRIKSCKDYILANNNHKSQYIIHETQQKKWSVQVLNPPPSIQVQHHKPPQSIRDKCSCKSQCICSIRGIHQSEYVLQFFQNHSLHTRKGVPNQMSHNKRTNQSWTRTGQ